MNRKHVAWLIEQLPGLVTNGVIAPEVADRLRQHYGEPTGSAKRWAIVLFSILGAALIGGGIILLLAHNWEQLSRPMRAGIAVAPLFIAQLLAGWTLWTRRDSTAWREGTGTAITLGIGVAMALISQTYNLGGRFDEFMLTSSLLVLPVAYLLTATVPALLYLVGILIWTGSVMRQPGTGLWYFPLAAAAVPLLWLMGRANRYHPRPVLVAWALAITVCIGTGLALERICERLDVWPVVFAGLFAVQFLVGTRWWDAATSVWQRPLQTVGGLATVGLALALSFSDTWDHVRWDRYWELAQPHSGIAELAITFWIVAAAVALWVRSITRRATLEIMVGVVPVLAVVGLLNAIVGAVLFNLYLFGLGIGTLVVGLRGRRLGVVNAGMFVLAAVILCRFFDSDIGFLAKGTAFIIVGIGFLVTNLMLRRQRKGATAV